MSQLAVQDDEINLSEFVAAVWGNLGTVVLCIVLFATTFGIYAFWVAVPTFQATTRFELLESEQGGASLGQATALASIAGLDIPAQASEVDAMKDRILSRPFVESIYSSADFASDPIFNKFIREPGFVDRLLGFFFETFEVQSPTRQQYLVSAINGLSDRLQIDPGDNGIVSLTISHLDGERASDLANIIVERSLLDIFERERNEVRESLNYFADELLQVRADLDEATASLSSYAVSNNIRSASELERRSLQLSQIRQEIGVVDDSIEALNAMKRAEFNGAAFALEFPIVSSLSFRRLLNLSGNPQNWEQPSSARIDEEIGRLEVQRASLVSSSDSLKAKAEIAGAEAIELAALEREVEVQQAVYQSLITQFEARSLLSGFERASGRVLETAIAPEKPASPNKVLVVSFGIFLGLLFGVAIALVRAARKGLVFTRKELERIFQMPDTFLVEHKAIMGRGSRRLDDYRTHSARELFVTLNKSSKLLAICPVDGDAVAMELAVMLSSVPNKMGAKTAILDLAANRNANFVSDKLAEDYDGLESGEERGGLTVFKAKNSLEFVDSDKMSEALEKLRNDYSYVFVVLPPATRDTSLLRICSQIVNAALIIAPRAKTSRNRADILKNIMSNSKVSDKILLIA